MYRVYYVSSYNVLMCICLVQYAVQRILYTTDYTCVLFVEDGGERSGKKERNSARKMDKNTAYIVKNKIK